MSDLFKRNPPRMTDDEDRRVWERVRQAARPLPWWAAAWQRPAVRYGLPAVAVVLVALVWVAVEQPASTHAPAPRAVALERAQPAPQANAPTASESPGLAAPPAPPLAMPEKKAAPRREARDFAAAPPPAPAVVGGEAGAGAASPAEPPARAKTLLKDEPVAAQNEAAPAPAAPAPAAPAPAPQTLAPAKPSTSNWGKVTSQYRGGASESIAPTQRSLATVRGGRADELPVEVAAPGSALATVAAALVHRPLAFTAPLPVSPEPPYNVPQAVRIEVDGTGAARSHLVPPGAPGQTYARYIDTGPAERILLVAFSADQLGANAPADRVAFLRAEAARLATPGAPESAAAQALLDRLSRLGN